MKELFDEKLEEVRAILLFLKKNDLGRAISIDKLVEGLSGNLKPLVYDVNLITGLIVMNIMLRQDGRDGVKNSSDELYDLLSDRTGTVV